MAGDCGYEAEVRSRVGWRKRDQKVEDDEWVQPNPKGYRMACCDCGLVHVFDFEIHKGRIQFKARRDNRATAAKRRAKKYVPK